MLFALLFAHLTAHATITTQTRCERLVAFKEKYSLIDNSQRHELLGSQRYFSPAQTALLYTHGEEADIRVYSRIFSFAKDVRVSVVFFAMRGERREQYFSTRYLRRRYDVLDRKLKENSYISRYLEIRILDPNTKLRLRKKREVRLTYLNGAAAFAPETYTEAEVDPGVGSSFFRRDLVFDALDSAAVQGGHLGYANHRDRVSPWRGNTITVNLTNLTLAEIDTTLNILVGRIEALAPEVTLGVSPK